jgi:hypothetical protein
MRATIKASRRAGQTRRNGKIRTGSRAVARAFTGAKLWLGQPVSFPAQGTQGDAAEITGTNVVYLWAASVLLQHGDNDLIKELSRAVCRS